MVILVHGYNACRRDWTVLLPAGMLHQAGFGVVVPDLRNHGDSDIDDGRWAGGAKEYRDVLGAFDWLRAHGVPGERIGIFGASLGAATATIATGEEPGVAALWADSSYAT
ncbi:MAG TPA: alpha/beta fold hydrolase, partial [Candidatus Deferrimicrobium sp.]|nr:alpha/beta fold hydrolase [Candidatus Deferrimicrobium sp.]